MSSISMAILGLLIGVSTSAYGADTLESFSQQCDQAIGVTVPDFNADAGTLVPTDHLTPANATYPNGTCDRPNVLNGNCDPGSRFQVLVNTPEAYVVAHARKTGDPPGQFGDIAVIQHNKVNGATCFYQGALNKSHNGNVKAPSKGIGNPPFWMTPTEIATSTFPCVRCHDNGPIIRSPYLAQITGPNKLPGAGDSTFNRNQPYSFVGSDFAHWKAYKVEVSGNICNSCHRMGVNNVSSTGTARTLGIIATGPSQDSKNPHSANSPIWMVPGQVTYSQASADAAKAIKQCADQFHEGSPLPNTAGCKITLFASMHAANGGTVGPAAGGWVTSWGNNRLDIFGLGTDGAMYHKAWDGTAWRPSVLDWERLGGVFTSPPAVTAWGNNRLDIFGLGTDGAMYHKAWDGTAWRPSVLDWERLGGVFTSPPAVTAWGNNRLDIFGLGTDGAMYHKAWDGTAWRPSVLDWERLGGVFTSPPAVTAWGNNRLDIFGLGTDGAMYHKAWDGTAWRPSVLDWERLGGVFTSPPAVTAWGNNRLDIFGLGTDGAMYHKAWDGTAWRPSVLDWERLGGVFTSPPAVTAWGNNRLDIFGLGTDGAMYHKAWDGTAWRPSVLDWERLGGVFTSPPAVTAWGNNRLDIFGLGTDGAMYHKAWDGTAWRPSVLDWERLGGIFSAP